MNIVKIEDKYKIKFHNLFVKHFLSLTGGYDMQKDYECMYRLINGGRQINEYGLKFILLTSSQLILQLQQLISMYNIMVCQSLDLQDGCGFVISFDFNKIDQLKCKRSKNMFQKELKQLIINCYRAFKKELQEN